MMSREDAEPKVSQEDAESNARLVDALFGSAEEAQRALFRDPSVASHLQLDLDETGKPKLLRFAYVDEQECIGCTYCASVASNTFFMEEEAGRARVFAQGEDDPELVMEAVPFASPFLILRVVSCFLACAWR